MKTIIFIPTFWYLSLELFKELSLCLGNEVKKVFLETGDPTFKSLINDKYDVTFFDKYFDAAFFLDYPKSQIQTVLTYWEIFYYNRRLKRIIKEHNPDLIITTGDRNNFYPHIKKLCPKTPIVIMQTALIHAKYYLSDYAAR